MGSGSRRKLAPVENGEDGPVTIASGLRGPKTGPLSGPCQANARTEARLRTVNGMASRAAPLFAQRVAWTSKGQALRVRFLHGPVARGERG